MLKIKSNRGFFSIKGGVGWGGGGGGGVGGGGVIKINDPIWPVFKLVRDFICVHLISKFQDDMIKTE